MLDGITGVAPVHECYPNQRISVENADRNLFSLLNENVIFTYPNFHETRSHSINFCGHPPVLIFIQMGQKL
jgi:hypothetical protein